MIGLLPERAGVEISGRAIRCAFHETKNRERRIVPLTPRLAKMLSAHLLATGRRGEALVFGSTDARPFLPEGLSRRADAAWKAKKLRRITLHECRHTFASLMIAAGVNAKALSTYMGHHSVAFTYDRYGHLMPGNEEEAAKLLDTYLAGAASA